MVTIKRVQTQLGKNLEIAVKNLQGKVVKVGWVEKKRYPAKPIIKEGKHVGSVIPPYVATVAAINEFGSPSKKIPARPFMRPTIINQKNKWIKIANAGAKQILHGNLTIDGLMKSLGDTASNDVVKTIKQIFSPALSASTIQSRIRKYTSDTDLKEYTRKKRHNEVKQYVRSGFYKPLIDTGLMIASLTYSVDDE